MKRIFLPVAGIFSALLLSACSSDDNIKPYDKELTEVFVKNCAADIFMTRPLCACVVSEYEKTISQNKLIAYYKERVDGKGLPQEFIDAEVAAQASCFVQLNDGPVPKGQYPAQVVKAFINECQSSLSEDMCGCLVDHIATQLPLVDYLAANTHMNNTGVMMDNFADAMTAAGQKCGTASGEAARQQDTDTAVPESADAVIPDDRSNNADSAVEPADAVVHESTDSSIAEDEAVTAHEHQAH